VFVRWGQVHAKVYLDSGQREPAKEVLDRIEQLDAHAVVHNAECAALAGRWYRSGGNLQKAEEIFAAALDATPDSYYLANVLAEVRLEAGRTDLARDAFRRAVAIIHRLAERNVWIFATAANASFVLGGDDRAMANVERIRQRGPSADDLNSIERGRQNIAKHVDEGERRARKLIAALRA
jgi:tetratricopeptide (TPR) repeat protein